MWIATMTASFHELDRLGRIALLPPGARHENRIQQPGFEEVVPQPIPQNPRWRFEPWFWEWPSWPAPGIGRLLRRSARLPAPRCCPADIFALT